MKITCAPITAWLTDYSSLGPADFKEGMSAHEVAFSASDMAGAGWTRVGDALIVLEVPDAQTMIDNKIDALRAHRRAVLADAHEKATTIDRKINELLALPMTPPTQGDTL